MTAAAGPTPTAATPPSPPRTPKEIIDEAIAENKGWDTLCYCLIVAFAVVGLGAIGYGAVYNVQWAAIGGSVSTGLLGVTLYQAVGIRRANMAIRMLEVPLSHAKTAQQAADAIREVFTSHFKKGRFW